MAIVAPAKRNQILAPIDLRIGTGRCQPVAVASAAVAAIAMHASVLIITLLLAFRRSHAIVHVQTQTKLQSTA